MQIKTALHQLTTFSVVTGQPIDKNPAPEKGMLTGFKLGIQLDEQTATIHIGLLWVILFVALIVFNMS